MCVLLIYESNAFPICFCFGPVPPSPPPYGAQFYHLTLQQVLLNKISYFSKELKFQIFLSNDNIKSFQPVYFPLLKISRQLFSPFGNIFVRANLFSTDGGLPSLIIYFRRYGHKISFSNKSKYDGLRGPYALANNLLQRYLNFCEGILTSLIDSVRF